MGVYQLVVVIVCNFGAAAAVVNVVDKGANKKKEKSERAILFRDKERKSLLFDRRYKTAASLSRARVQINQIIPNRVIASLAYTAGSIMTGCN